MRYENKLRAERAERAVQAYLGNPNDEPDEFTVMMILCDLRHYCELKGYQFKQANKQGREYYHIEKGD